MVKFRTDKRALEEFKVLGKMYFTEKVIGNNDIYFQTYSSLYNGRSPFVRLIDEDELKRTFNLIIDSQNIILGLQRDSSIFYNTKQSYYYFILKKIERIVESKMFKKHFHKLVNNKTSYIKPSNDNFDNNEIKVFMQDYLYRYIIYIKAN